jgi:hypothetical protein
MTKIYLGLASEKKPLAVQTIDWTDTAVSRATLAVKGGSLEDLDNRSAANQVLRTFDPANKIVVQVLDPGSKPAMNFTGFVVNTSTFEEEYSRVSVKYDGLMEAIEKLDFELGNFTDSVGSPPEWGLSTIQKVQTFESKMASLQEKANALAPTITVMAKCQEAGLEEFSRLSEQGKGDGASVTYRMPVLTSARPRVELQHRCKLGLPKPIVPWMLAFWQRHRVQFPTLLQYCPAAEVGGGGIPSPFSDEKAVLLSKWMRGKATSRPADLVAWYWYIVSWNRANPKRAVPLPKGCRNPYSRKQVPGDPRQKEKSSINESKMAQEMAALRRALEATLATQVPRAPTSSSVQGEGRVKMTVPKEIRGWILSQPFLPQQISIQPDGADGIVVDPTVRQNAVFRVLQESSQQLQELQLAKERISRLESLLDEMEREHHASQNPEPVGPGVESSVDDPEEQPEEVGSPPDIYLEGPFTWFIDPGMIQGQMVMKSFFGRDYFRAFTKDKPASQPGADPTPTKEKEKAKEEKTPKPGGGVSQENPLRAKGTPRSSGLTQEQKDRLRRKLGIPNPEPLDPAAWDKLSPQARTAYRKGTSLPHWAVTAVLKNPENLVLIESGVLTPSNPQAAMPTMGRKREQGHQVKGASDAWAALKGRFPGVGLFSNPSTKKEKSLKSGYDSLLKEFGKNPCFPKPKAKGRTGTAGRPGLRTGEAEPQLLQMFGLIGKLAQAFRG